MVLLFTYLQLRLFLDGMLVMMAIYAALSFWQQRKESYAWYSLYIICVLVMLQCHDRFYDKATFTMTSAFWSALTETLAFTAYIRFTMALVDFRRTDPLVYRTLKGLIGLMLVYTLYAIACQFLEPLATIRVYCYVGSRVVLIGVGYWALRRLSRLEDPIINYFLLGTFLYALGGTVALLGNHVLKTPFALDPANAFSFPQIYMQIAFVLEMLCFTLGLSLRNWQTERERLAMQAQLIEQLQENERKQQQLQRIRADIARDLHDDVGGDLSSISMLSQAANRELLTHPDRARDLLHLIGESSRQVLANMRQIVWSLRVSPPDNLTQAGQAVAETNAEPLDCRLRDTAESLFEHQPAQLHLDLPDPGTMAKLPYESCRNLHLLFKELLHNAVRHASAKNVYVSLMLTDTYLRLRVSDDGVGFVVGNVPATSTGLASMHERANELGGRLVIQSEPGRGTTCTFDADLHPAPLETTQPETAEWREA